MSEMIERVARAICGAEFPRADQDAEYGYNCAGEFVRGGEGGETKPQAWMWFEPHARAAIAAFLSCLPKHKGALIITHNEHRNVYGTVERHAEKDCCGDWVSDDERLKAIATNEIWEMQWYPDTPVGFCKLASSSLEAMIDQALKDGGE